MKGKKKWLSLLVATLMLVIAATPVFAQSETDPLEEPAPAEETSGFWEHPIVKLLADFFSGLFTAPEPEESVEESGEPAGPPAGGDPLSLGEPPADPPADGEGESLEPEPAPVVSPEEAVAALHEEQDLGFGELAKLMQIVVEANAACAPEEPNCNLTLDGLIAEYKDGTGMGQLFEIYGKPSITGVGQVRKTSETGEPDAQENKGNGNSTQAREKNNNRNTKEKTKKK